MLIHEGDNVGVSLCLTIFAYIYPHITVCCRFRSIDVVLVKMTGMDRFKFGGVYIFLSKYMQCSFVVAGGGIPNLP